MTVYVAVCAGGTVVCGVIGLFWRVLVGREVWIAAALSVGTSLTALELMAIPFPSGQPHVCRYNKLQQWKLCMRLHYATQLHCSGYPINACFKLLWSSI